MEEAVGEGYNSKLKKYFLSFSTKYWKNGKSQAKNFTRPDKNSKNIGRMEEAMEEGNNTKL